MDSCEIGGRHTQRCHRFYARRSGRSAYGAAAPKTIFFMFFITPNRAAAFVKTKIAAPPRTNGAIDFD